MLNQGQKAKNKQLTVKSFFRCLMEKNKFKEIRHIVCVSLLLTKLFHNIPGKSLILNIIWINCCVNELPFNTIPNILYSIFNAHWQNQEERWKESAAICECIRQPVAKVKKFDFVSMTFQVHRVWNCYSRSGYIDESCNRNVLFIRDVFLVMSSDFIVVSRTPHNNFSFCNQLLKQVGVTQTK